MGIGSAAFKALNYASVPLAGASVYSDQRKEGHGFIRSAAVGLAEGMLFNAFQWPIMAYQLSPMIDMGLQALNRQTGNMQRNITPNGGAFGLQNDSQAAQTSRGRGVQAIMESRMNSRSYLGMESQLFNARYR